MSKQRTLLLEPPSGARRARPAARENVQNRIADRITAYAGSMHFVYLHIALFAIWMLFIEKSPWPTLTLIGQYRSRVRGVSPADASHGPGVEMLQVGG